MHLGEVMPIGRVVQHVGFPTTTYPSGRPLCGALVRSSRATARTPTSDHPCSERGEVVALARLRRMAVVDTASTPFGPLARPMPICPAGTPSAARSAGHTPSAEVHKVTVIAIGSRVEPEVGSLEGHVDTIVERNANRAIAHRSLAGDLTMILTEHVDRVALPVDLGHLPAHHDHHAVRDSNRLGVLSKRRYFASLCLISIGAIVQWVPPSDDVQTVIRSATAGLPLLPTATSHRR